MQPWQEPVRGAPLPAAAFSVSGLERLRGYGRGLWPNSPTHHLVGFRTTQVSNGSGVASMPITPWLAHPDGFIDVGLLLEAVCGIAAESTLPPRETAIPFQFSITPLRHLDPETRTMVGRAHVVRTTPDWIYAEGTVEDGDGRIAASGGVQMAIREVAFPVPHEPGPMEPIEHPSYPTPDPYQRPFPVEKHEIIRQFHERGVFDVFERIIAGEASLPPLYELIGIRPAEIREGGAVTTLHTSPWLTAFDANVAPAFIGTFGLDVCGATNWTLTQPGRTPSFMHWSTTLIRSVPADGRVLTARAEGEKLSDDIIRVRSEVWDSDQRIMAVTMNALLTGTPAPMKFTTSRVLSTVLFSDIVGSTEQAERVGDAAWNDTLSRHYKLLQSEVASHGGRIVKTTGDGALATFGTPTAAVEAARAIRDGVGRLGIEIRAGIHTGECEMAGGDIAGIAVHAAARIEAAAGTGEVWVSETTKALTAGSGLQFAEQGEHQLKGLDEPLRLYRVE